MFRKKNVYSINYKSEWILGPLKYYMGERMHLHLQVLKKKNMKNVRWKNLDLSFYFKIAGMCRRPKCKVTHHFVVDLCRGQCEIYWWVVIVLLIVIGNYELYATNALWSHPHNKNVNGPGKYLDSVNRQVCGYRFEGLLTDIWHRH